MIQKAAERPEGLASIDDALAAIHADIETRFTVFRDAAAREPVAVHTAIGAETVRVLRSLPWDASRPAARRFKPRRFSGLFALELGLYITITMIIVFGAIAP